MAKNHGAKQQKKLAKQKAKRAAKQSELNRRHSPDPTVRFQKADKWPVYEAYIGGPVLEEGIGHVVLARKVSEGELVYGVFLVDSFLLGVKNAFWHSGTPGAFKELVAKINGNSRIQPASAACAVKLVTGSVDYAKSFGFPPHPDYKHAALLFKGIDPAECTQEFTFGRDGKPFYYRGPHETRAQAQAIAARVIEAGGDYVIPLSDPSDPDAMFLENAFANQEFDDEEEFDDEPDDDDDLPTLDYQVRIDDPA